MSLSACLPYEVQAKLSKQANGSLQGTIKFLKATEAELENELEAVRKDIRTAETQLLCTHDLQFDRNYAVSCGFGRVYQCTKCGVTTHESF